MTTTYNFTYSALAYGDMSYLIANGGSYGTVTGTLDVSGTAVINTYPSSNQTEIDSVVDFFTQFPKSTSPIVLTGSNNILQPWPTTYYVNSGVFLKGTLTFNGTTEDIFYLEGLNLKLTNISEFILGNTNQSNIYINGLGGSLYLAQTTNYGNFIANNIEYTGTNPGEPITVIGTLTAATNAGIISGNSINTLTVTLPQLTYNFTYTALANTKLVQLNAYGGYYGIADVSGTVDVSGNSTLITDTSSNDQEITDILAFVNQLPLSGSAIDISGSDQVIEPYPARYAVSNLTGTLTFNATSSSDTFFIFSNYIDLRGITSYILGLTQPYNIYFIAISTTASSTSIYPSSSCPNYGNFIAQYVLAYDADASITGTVTGIITGTETQATCGGRPSSATETVDTYLTVNFARSPPTYIFSYVAISNENITYVNLVGGFYGAPNIKDITVTGSILKDSTEYLPELANITDFYNEVTTFLASPIFTINAIEDGNVSYDILPISTNTWNTISLPDLTSATFNFIGTTDDIFYIYNPSTPMYLSNISFTLNSANINNIYFIGGTIYLSSFTMYGNFITNSKLFKYQQDPPAILYGTTSAIIDSNARIVQPINVNDKYLTINFTTECFMKGTKILTDHWYVPIEELKVGDMVMSYGVIQDNKFHKVDSPVPQHIVKIRKTVQKATRSSCPIVIVQNAFAPNKPFENLIVSFNHGIVDHKGELYAASNYLNNTTIYQDPTIEIITYYHIELAAHCAIMANGVLTESWRESK